MVIMASGFARGRLRTTTTAAAAAAAAAMVESRKMAAILQIRPVPNVAPLMCQTKLNIKFDFGATLERPLIQTAYWHPT